MPVGYGQIREKTHHSKRPTPPMISSKITSITEEILPMACFSDAGSVSHCQVNTANEGGVVGPMIKATSTTDKP